MHDIKFVREGLSIGWFSVQWMCLKRDRTGAIKWLRVLIAKSLALYWSCNYESSTVQDKQQEWALTAQYLNMMPKLWIAAVNPIVLLLRVSYCLYLLKCGPHRKVFRIKAIHLHEVYSTHVLYVCLFYVPILREETESRLFVEKIYFELLRTELNFIRQLLVLTHSTKFNWNPSRCRWLHV
jgi:hypothetical protein